MVSVCAAPIIEREDSDRGSWQPLLPISAAFNASTELETASHGAEQAQTVRDAVKVLQKLLETLRKRVSPSAHDTAELLRDTCQALGDLAMRLTRAWQQDHPGEPEPAWVIEQIPGEELALIGWDFYSNRVMLRNTGTSLWESMALLFSGDQSSSFHKTPSSHDVMEALTRAVMRLSGSRLLLSK